MSGRIAGDIQYNENPFNNAEKEVLMRIKRKAAAGLCALMLAQSCIPASAAFGRTAAVKEETERETEIESKEQEFSAKSDVKSPKASIRQKLSLNEDTGEAQIQIELEGTKKGNVLTMDIPEGYEVKGVFQAMDQPNQVLRVSEADWKMEGQQFTCQVDPAFVKTSDVIYQIICGFTNQQWEAYAKSGEGLERQLISQARLCSSDGKVLGEAPAAKKELKRKPFLEMEAEGQDRSERTFLWTNWLNLGMGAGEGYLISVIEDLENGQRFDFKDNSVMILDSDGEEIARLPVSEAAPEQAKAFGEIFTVEDAKLLAGGADGAVFYSYEDDDKKQNGILLVPVDSLRERIGISYQTRVSASEQPEVYQWDAALHSGSKFVWNRREEDDEWEEYAGLEQKSDGKTDDETRSATKAEADREQKTETDTAQVPVWELKADRIPGAEAAAKAEQTAFSSESLWLETRAVCSLVSQTVEEDGYDKEKGTASWDFLVNQNGENLQEVVITREIPSDEQTYSGDLADGRPLKAALYEDEDWDVGRGKKVEIPAFEEGEFKEASEEEEGFFGYYVLELDESGKAEHSLEIHLFRLGQAACEFQVETEIKDTVFADCPEAFGISSGRTEYTAVLAQPKGRDAESPEAEPADAESPEAEEAKSERTESESTETEGSCEAEIPCENQWIRLEAAETEDQSCYDYENHSIAWEMTVNPEQHSLLEPQVTVTLPDGLEQVKLEQAVFTDEKGKKRDITEDEWIQVEETAPNKRKKERKAVFTWREAEDEEEGLSPKGTYQITFTCQVLDDMRKECFREEEPREFVLSCELEGMAGTEEENRRLQSAEYDFSCSWNSAAVSGSGQYQETKFDLENSVWDGMQMPRADWCALVNRNGADLTDTTVRLTWPQEMMLDAGSVQIAATKLNEDGTETDETERILQPDLAKEIQVSDTYLEFTIPEELTEEVLAVTYSSFAASDMEESDFKGTYRLTKKNDILEEGELAVEGAKAVSAAEAAEKNRIPTAVITASSANEDAKLSYRLSGGGYRLVKLTAEEENGSWEDYEDAVNEEGEETAVIEETASSNGRAVFWFLEQDVIYRLEEKEPVPGYEPWEQAKYVAVLDQKSRSDFPKDDDSHKLITGKEQVLIEDTRVPAKWENDGEVCEGGQIAFFIQDQEGRPIEDAACSLTYVDYVNPGSRGLRSRTASSNEDGLVVFDGLDGVTENQEGYEIHVTAPAGLEDPAEFSAAVIRQEDGTFSAILNGKAVEQKKDGAYVTCLPVTADVQIPVTDQNGTLLKGCGLTLTVERLEDDAEADETETDDKNELESTASYVLYEPCPQVSEDGSGYITIADLPYGTYRLSGGTAILTLVIDDSGVEAALEAVEKENEREDGISVRLDLTADSRGIFGAGEEEGWYLEELLPRASVALTLTDADNPKNRIEGGRFLVYETWSNRLVGELKPDDEKTPESKAGSDDEDGDEPESEKEPGIYRLSPSDRKEAVKENDRGYEYLKKMDGSCRLLPGTYGIWQVESAEGYEPADGGIWYFTVGADSDEISNDDLTAGDGNWKLFENSVIRVPVPVSTRWTDQPEGDSAQPDVTLLLKGTSWNAGSGDSEYEQSITCQAGGSAAFEQVPVGIYVISASEDPVKEPNPKPGSPNPKPGKSGKAAKAKTAQSSAVWKASGKIQVQVQFDGQIIFRTISGRELEQAELVLREDKPNEER